MIDINTVVTLVSLSIVYCIGEVRSCASLLSFFVNQKVAPPSSIEFQFMHFTANDSLVSGVIY